MRHRYLLTALLTTALIAAAIAVVAVVSQDISNPKIQDFVVAVLVSLVVGIVGVFYKDPLVAAGKALTQPRSGSSIITIYLYGSGGSGKTTLISRLLTQSRLDLPQEPTQAYALYEREISPDLQSKPYTLRLADYKGQSPAQIVTEIDGDFTGSKRSRLVNAVFFIVDPFDRQQDDNGNLLSDSEIIDRLEPKTIKAKIEARVKQHQQYINPAILQLIFSVVYSKKNLHTIKLLINKFDLMQEIVKRGLLRDLKTSEDAQAYLRQLFSPIEQEIRAACEANNLGNAFSVHVISLRDAAANYDVNGVLDELLTRHVDFSQRGD